MLGRVGIANNLHQFQQVETPNPPAPFPQREGGAGNLTPLPPSMKGGGAGGGVKLLIENGASYQHS